MNQLAYIAKMLGVFVFVATLCSVLPEVLAAVDPTKDLTAVGGAFGGETQLGVIIGRGIRVLFNIIGIMLTLLLLYAGFLWFNARGNTKEVEKAQELIRESIIGLAVILAAQAITYFVLEALAKRVLTGTP